MTILRVMTRRVRALAAALCGAAALAGCSLPLAVQAADDPPGRVGRVATVWGQAWLLDDDGNEWTVVPRNQPITRGDRLLTDGDSRLELQIGSTVLRLDGRTEVLLSRLDDEQVAVRLLRGSAALRLRQPEVVRDWSLDTAEGSLLPAGTGHFRLDLDGRSIAFSVLTGEARFVEGGNSLSLRGGQRADIEGPGGRPWQVRWTGLADDDFERWLRREDDNDNRWADRDGLSPEMTGIQELDRHGRWDRHPEYGAIWSPNVVPSGWAPYRYGRWAWVAPWGWTWVDDAPWGFAPSHYGRWMHWSGRWCWVPGPYVRRPVYAPALVAWVGGSHWGVSVSTGPMVSWVPLAPREAYRPHHPASPVWVGRVNGHPWGHDRDDRRDDPRHERQPPRQGEPVMYTNRGVPGGITAVPAQVLQQRQPVHQAPRLADEVVHRAAQDPRQSFSAVAPPSAPAWRRAPGGGEGEAAIRSAPGVREPAGAQDAGRNPWSQNSREVSPSRPAPSRSEGSARPELPAVMPGRSADDGGRMTGRPDSRDGSAVRPVPSMGEPPEARGNTGSERNIPAPLRQALPPVLGGSRDRDNEPPAGVWRAPSTAPQPQVPAMRAPEPVRPAEAVRSPEPSRPAEVRDAPRMQPLPPSHPAQSSMGGAPAMRSPTPSAAPQREPSRGDSRPDKEKPASPRKEGRSMD